MERSKTLISFVLVSVVVLTQIGTVFAAPALQDEQHPVGAALADYFSEITDYDAIMQAHEDGVGFGVIAQALWLTQKLAGDNDMFLAILLAKKTGDYSAFTYEDGTPLPQNWGQFKKLILDGEKMNGLGIVMSNKGQEHANNGGGNDNGNGNMNGNGAGNGNPDKSHNNDMGNHGNNDNKGNGKHR